MNVIAIIPARMASTRFKGKPLAQIQGMSMVAHIYFRTQLCGLITKTYVATCDTEIYDHIRSVGGNAIMTGAYHERCSDRAAEAILKIERENSLKTDVVVIVQGDEPMVTPAMIEKSIGPFLSDPSVKVVNLMGRIKTEREFEDPNQIKVVVDRFYNALYFSREPIPSRKKTKEAIPMFKQICVIPFRRDYLLEYTKLSPTPLEIVESVDMMRVLEHGDKVRMVLVDEETHSVDTPQDLRVVSQIMQRDPIVPLYHRAVPA